MHKENTVELNEELILLMKHAHGEISLEEYSRKQQEYEKGQEEKLHAMGLLAK